MSQQSRTVEVEMQEHPEAPERPERPQTTARSAEVAAQRRPASPSAGDVRQGSVATRGLAQMFGLDIRAAVLVILVDLMLFGGNVLSLGLLLWLGLIVAAVLGYIVYQIQTQWYGDDHDSAVIKSMIVGLLTAIPAPLTPVMAIPCGLLGLIHMVWGGRR